MFRPPTAALVESPLLRAAGAHRRVWRLHRGSHRPVAPTGESRRRSTGGSRAATRQRSALRPTASGATVGETGQPVVARCELRARLPRSVDEIRWATDRRATTDLRSLLLKRPVAATTHADRRRGRLECRQGCPAARRLGGPVDRTTCHIAGARGCMLAAHGAAPSGVPFRPSAAARSTGVGVTSPAQLTTSRAPPRAGERRARRSECGEPRAARNHRPLL